MPTFSSNYPGSKTSLLSTPERTGALAEYTGKGITIAFDRQCYQFFIALARQC